MRRTLLDLGAWLAGPEACLVRRALCTVGACRLLPEGKNLRPPQKLARRRMSTVDDHARQVRCTSS